MKKKDKKKIKRMLKFTKKKLVISLSLMFLFSVIFFPIMSCISCNQRNIGFPLVFHTENVWPSEEVGREVSLLNFMIDLIIWYLIGSYLLWKYEAR